MGRMEQESAKRSKRANIQKIILSTVAVSGVLATGVLAPNVLGAMAKMGFIPGKRQTEIIKRARERLVQKGMLIYESGHFKITARGQKYLHSVRALEKAIPQKSRWDKKWRVLIFDIPESRRKLRDKIRNTLRGLGFIRLQDSVWIYPYDCEDLVALLKADFRIGKDLLYMIVDSLENDTALCSAFGLKK